MTPDSASPFAGLVRAHREPAVADDLGPAGLFASLSAGPVPFAELLRRHRDASGLSRPELAGQVLIDVRALDDLERGGRGARRQTASLLADALGLGGPVREEFEAAARASWGAAPGADGPVSGPDEGEDGLPVYAGAVLGRGAELEQLDGWVADGIRLVTVTGPGGVGKTRLVAEAGARLRARGLRVVFVPLGAAATPRDVLSAVAAALRVGTDEDDGGVRAIRSALARRDCVLVLDNLEQVPGVAPTVSALAAANRCGARWTVLVSSRAVLRLNGERELRVAPLPVPPERGTLADWPATRLFLDRARAADPGFAPGGEEAAAVIELCRRIDGLPLAIELVAPWVRQLPPEQLLARVLAGIGEPSAVTVDVPDRHRSLAVAIDSSYQLLDEPARTLYRRLAVFPAAFEPELAELVCGAGELDVPDGLAALRAARLLAAGRDAEGGLRLHFLPAVRDHAAAVLHDSGEADEVRARHAEAVTALVVAAAARLVLADQGFWLERLDRCVEDVRAAHSWLLEGGSVAGAARLAGHSWRYWYLGGLLPEGRARLGRTLEAVAGSAGPAEPGDHALLLYGAGVLSYLSGEVGVAVERYHRALAAYQAIGDRVGAANSLNNLGMVALHRGDPDAAAEHHRQAYEQARLGGDARAQGVSLASLAKVTIDSGRLAEAEAAADQAVAILRPLGDSRTLADLHGQLAEARSRLGDRAGARRLYEQALDGFTALGDRPGIAPVLVELAALDLAEGNPAAGLVRLNSALAMAEELADPWITAIALEGIARHDWLAGDPDGAHRRLAAAEECAVQVGDIAVLARLRALATDWKDPSPATGC